MSSTVLQPDVTRTYVLTSRSSKLALIQTNFVRDAFQSAYPTFTFVTSFDRNTLADRNQTLPLWQLGRQNRGIFSEELEEALKDEKVDLAVHCLKDLPSQLPEGLELGAIMEKEDPADCLVVKAGLTYKSLAELPDGSVVGTSSVRRTAQLKRSFPTLKAMVVRGNIDTRLAKLDDPDGPYVALVLAKAGLLRYGAGDRITTDLSAPPFYPAVGQGALALQIRSSDLELRQMCKALNHLPTEWASLAERGLLRKLEGGCSIPVGAQSKLDIAANGHSGILTLTSCVTALDGSAQVEHTLTETVSSREEAEAVGTKLGGILLASGAKAMIDEIREAQNNEVALK